MKLLAIESSGLVASAAVFADDTIVAEFTVNNKQTHSQTLLPMIDQVVTMSGIDLKEIDAIRVHILAPVVHYQLLGAAG